jgi:hypothetical protein
MLFAAFSRSLHYPVHLWYDGPGQRLRVEVYGGLDATYVLPVRAPADVWLASHVACIRCGLHAMCKVLQSTVSLANSQHVMLLMADLRAPKAHGTCSYQTSVIPIYRSPNNF